MKKRIMIKLLGVLVCFFCVTIPLQAGTVIITVKREVDKSTYEPVSNVKCSLRHEKNVKRSLSKTTNKKGKVTIENVPKGKFELRTGSDDFKKGGKYEDWALKTSHASFELSKKEKQKRIEIVCKKAAIVRGKATGNVNGLSVLSKFTNQNVGTDGQVFKIGGLPPNEDVMVLVMPSGPFYVKEIHLEKSKLKQGEVTDIGEVYFPKLPENQYLNIVAVDRDGKSLSEREFAKVSKPRSMILFKGNKIDGNIVFKGLRMYRKSNLPEGKYTLSYMHKPDKKIKFEIKEKQSTTIQVHTDTWELSIK